MNIQPLNPRPGPLCRALLGGALLLASLPGLGTAQPALTSLANPEVRYAVPDKPYVVLRHGGLEAVVVDNRAVDDAVLPGHRAGYHGLASLKHDRQPRNLFVPAYAGLNFEHIHDGTFQKREVLYEPRFVPMELRVIDARTAELHQAPTPFWHGSPRPATSSFTPSQSLSRPSQSSAAGARGTASQTRRPATASHTCRPATAHSPMPFEHGWPAPGASSRAPLQSLSAPSQTSAPGRTWPLQGP